jgi:hypothetical protein
MQVANGRERVSAGGAAPETSTCSVLFAHPFGLAVILVMRRR